MRRSLLPPLFFFLVVVPLISADETGQGEKKLYWLRLSFKKGEKIYYRSTNVHIQKAFMMDEKKVEETSIIEFLVEDIAEDGTATVIRRELKILYSSPEGEYWNEGKVGHPLPKNKRKVFQARLRNSLKGMITPSGKAKDVEGIEKMLSDMKDYIDEVMEYLLKSPQFQEEAKEKPQVKEKIRKLVVLPIEAGIRYSFAFFDFLPEKNVSVGDEWKVLQDKKIVTIKWTAKLDRVTDGDGLAHIILKLDAIKYNEEEYPLAKRTSPENVNGKGKIELDITAGKIRLLEVEMSYDLKDRLSGTIVASHCKRGRVELLEEVPRSLKEPAKENEKKSKGDEEER